MDTELEKIQVVNVGPGDVLVVQYEERFTQDVFARLKSQMQENFPNIPVLILEAGFSLSVVHQEGLEENG